MDKNLKRKIRRLWRYRFLIIFSGLFVLVFSTVQLLRCLKHRPPRSLWVMELAQSVENLRNEHTSKAEIDVAISKIQKISGSHKLSLINSLINSLTVLYSLPDDPLLGSLHDSFYYCEPFDLRPGRFESIESNEELVTQRISQVRNLQLIKLLLCQNSTIRALTWDQLQIRIDGSIWTRSRDSYWTREEKDLLTFLVEVEVQQNHGIALPQGNGLEKLLNSEPDRARVLTQSSVLLGISLFVLLSLLILYGKLENLPTLSPSSHLIAFLPEESVAEMGYLKNRLRKRGISPWEIRKRLIHEFAYLLWAYYIQMKLDNLFLGSNRDHTIDD